MLISAPKGTSVIFGVFQAMAVLLITESLGRDALTHERGKTRRDACYLTPIYTVFQR